MSRSAARRENSSRVADSTGELAGLERTGSKQRLVNVSPHLQSLRVLQFQPAGSTLRLST
jgi:hypothetical protein